MPNWCSNTATFKHSDPEQIRKVIAAYNEGKLFGSFFPCPEDLLSGVSPAPEDTADTNIEKYGASDWYSWCVENWGTKWDVGAGGAYDAVEYTEGQTEVTLSFDSAWAPPLNWYNEMDDEFSFEIEAYYLEEGMGFCGKWSNEDWDADEYEFAGQSAEWVQANIPVDIIEHWDLISLLEMYAEDEDDEAD